MNVLKIMILIILVCIPRVASSSNMEEIFGSGILNTNWGMDMTTVQEQYPEGRAVEYVGLTQFEISDGRTVLNVERKKTDKISFSFDAKGRLSGIGVYYELSKFGELLSKLNTLFGSHKNKQTSFGTVVEWSQEDNVKLSLMQVSSDVIFTVEYFGLDKPGISKKELGLGN